MKETHTEISRWRQAETDRSKKVPWYITHNNINVFVYGIKDE